LFDHNRVAGNYTLDIGNLQQIADPGSLCADAAAGTKYTCAFDAGVGPETVSLVVTISEAGIIQKAKVSSVFVQDANAMVQRVGLGMVVFSAGGSGGATQISMSFDDLVAASRANALVVLGSFDNSGASRSAAVVCNPSP
jgi:hypothetical protein